MDEQNTMGGCSLAWIDIVRKDEKHNVRDYGRFAKIVESLPDPERQRPSLQLFIGGNIKQLAFRRLFPRYRLEAGIRDGMITLRSDRQTLDTECPVLVAEGYPDSHANPCRKDAPTRDERGHQVLWDVHSNRELTDRLYSHLVCRFADLVCIFADDFKDFEDVVRLLQAWSELVGMSNDQTSTGPGVVVVLTLGSDITNMDGHIGTLAALGTQSPALLFVETVVLHGRFITGVECDTEQGMKGIIQRSVDRVRVSKHAKNGLLSALHMEKLFDYATSHFAATRTRSFNAITASRTENPLDSEHQDHLLAFLQLARRTDAAHGDTLIYIAATLLVDAYPPKMHHFHPVSLFETLYAGACRCAIAKFGVKGAMIDMSLDATEGAFVRMFNSMIVSKATVAEVYKSEVSLLGIPWKLIQTTSTCLFCLRSKPQDSLSCGHKICEACIVIHGTEDISVDWRFRISNCLLCKAGSLDRVLKPPSAGLRFLCLDGGGAWGRVTLEILQQFQNLAGRYLPIEYFFDAVFGTSVGGIIVLILFVRRLGVSVATRIFEDLASKVFEDSRGRGNWLRRLWHFVGSWYRDGCCDSELLSSFYKAWLGADTRLSDPCQSPYRARVGVTATRVVKPSTVLFTNYNALQEAKGYERADPAEVEDEPMLWEIARATSAAPLFFKPIFMQGIGYLQDGAMSGHNNPSQLAKWECPGIDPGNRDPALLISVGTGRLRSEESPPSYTGRTLPSSLRRLGHRLTETFNGDSQSDHYLNNLSPERSDAFYRITATFQGDCLPLDAFDRLSEMEAQARQPRVREQVANAMYGLLAASFYFELDGVPRYDGSGYLCEGTIKCRFPGQPFTDLLARFHPSTLRFMMRESELACYSGVGDLCSHCRRYRKKVRFSVKARAEKVNITLDSQSRGERRLSGFPKSVEDFAWEQKLHCTFGTRDHRALQKTICQACSGSGTWSERRERNARAVKKRKLN